MKILLDQKSDFKCIMMKFKTKLIKFHDID